MVQRHYYEIIRAGAPCHLYFGEHGWLLLCQQRGTLQAVPPCSWDRGAAKRAVRKQVQLLAQCVPVFVDLQIWSLAERTTQGWMAPPLWTPC